MNIKSGCNAYCIKCATKIENDESICSKCGSRRVILGEDKIDYIRKDKEIVCANCENNSFSILNHINMITVDKYVYKCNKCNRTITMDIAKDPDNDWY